MQLHDGVHQLTVQDKKGFQTAHIMGSFNRQTVPVTEFTKYNIRKLNACLS
jgi:hypothetical protein